MRTCDPKVASNAITRPATFCPVPERIVSWSPKRSFGRTDSTSARSRFGLAGAVTSFEVAEPAEVLLHLGGLGFVGTGLDAGGGRHGLRARADGGLLADHRRQHLAVVLRRGRHVEGGEDGGG